MSDNNNGRGNDQSPPTWLPLTDLPILGDLAGAVLSGSGETVATSVVHGIAESGVLQRGIVTWSFDANSPDFSPDWPARHASMAFVSALSRHPDVQSTSVARFLVTATSGSGEAVTLQLEGVPTVGRVFPIKDLGSVVASVDAEPAFAAACLGLDEIPAFIKQM